MAQDPQRTKHISTPGTPRFQTHLQAARKSPGIWVLCTTLGLLLTAALYSALAASSWRAITIPSLLIIAATIPVLTELLLKSRFPTWLHTLYACFLLAGPLAGAQFRLYIAWPHWDKVIHTTSGFVVGFSTIVVLTVLHRRDAESLSPVVLVMGILTTAGFVAASWEIAEFTSDHVLGTLAQQGSLDDTMTDIICGITGAGVVAILTGLQLAGFRMRIIASLLAYRDVVITGDRPLRHKASDTAHNTCHRDDN